MKNIQADKPGIAGRAADLDAVAAALAPCVHAALDQEPSDSLRRAIRAAAAHHLSRRARIIVYVWRSAISLAAAGMLVVGLWSIENHRQTSRLQLLDHLLVLTAAPEAAADEQDHVAESLARRLLLLQGFDAEITAPEPVEAPALPATDAQWRNRRALPARICG
jgi:hypothetical protein